VWLLWSVWSVIGEHAQRSVVEFLVRESGQYLLPRQQFGEFFELVVGGNQSTSSTPVPPSTFVVVVVILVGVEKQLGRSVPRTHFYSSNAMHCIGQNIK